MECREAREEILERLAENWRDADSLALDAHQASCPACREFTAVQSRLEGDLSLAMAAPALSPAFRASTMKRIRRETPPEWSVLLPDIAHWVGGVSAVTLVLSLRLLPASQVLLGGTAFTFITYVVYTVLRAAVEEWEEAQAIGR